MSQWQILVIEDETDSMEFVQGLLEYHGINSVGATTGEEAIELLGRFRPEMIIIDLALPGLNGWELLSAIKSDPSLRKIPCVAITAYHTAELAEQAIEAGFSAYFAKPLDATSFVRELEGIANT
jgi:CheY-like chemotaxis protein